MSKSLRRVERHLAELGLEVAIQRVDTPTHTALQAAQAVGCATDQIAKSVIFRGERTGEVLLFLTAGGRHVELGRAATLAGEPVGKADAALIRARTGFAIGGVSPFGHLNPIRAFVDRRLIDFETIWAAAGTPNHLFPIAPSVLVEKTGARIGDFAA